MHKEVSSKIMILTITSLLSVIGLIAYFTLRAPGSESRSLDNRAAVVESSAEREALIKQFTEDPAIQLYSKKQSKEVPAQRVSSVPSPGSPD